jgi:hypothetical protein
MILKQYWGIVPPRLETSGPVYRFKNEPRAKVVRKKETGQQMRQQLSQDDY